MDAKLRTPLRRPTSSTRRSPVRLLAPVGPDISPIVRGMSRTKSLIEAMWQFSKD